MFATSVRDASENPLQRRWRILPTKVVFNAITKMFECLIQRVNATINSRVSLVLSTVLGEALSLLGIETSWSINYPLEYLQNVLENASPLRSCKIIF